eukprot:TRINITY_DN3387_c0_g1_i1.p1 TRINITY_DN3387_c0_g1~~TRINITY_DN3387_c0_g1_i1.p1  ORF type:complete len:1036 (+),score=325.40 TRINITY_DN3387_c0_g1_i1:103-3210(+)
MANNPQASFFTLARQDGQQREVEKRTGEVKDFIEKILCEKIEGDLRLALLSGVVLCRVLTLLRPDAIKDYTKDPKIKFKMMENLDRFIKGCSQVGVKDVFLSTDLDDPTKFIKVLRCLASLAHLTGPTTMMEVKEGNPTEGLGPRARAGQHIRSVGNMRPLSPEPNAGPKTSSHLLSTSSPVLRPKSTTPNGRPASRQPSQSSLNGSKPQPSSSPSQPDQSIAPSPIRPLSPSPSDPDPSKRIDKVTPPLRKGSSSSSLSFVSASPVKPGQSVSQPVKSTLSTPRQTNSKMSSMPVARGTNKSLILSQPVPMGDHGDMSKSFMVPRVPSQDEIQVEEIKVRFAGNFESPKLSTRRVPSSPAPKLPTDVPSGPPTHSPPPVPTEDLPEPELRVPKISRAQSRLWRNSPGPLSHDELVGSYIERFAQLNQRSLKDLLEMCEQTKLDTTDCDTRIQLIGALRKQLLSNLTIKMLSDISDKMKIDTAKCETKVQLVDKICDANPVPPSPSARRSQMSFVLPKDFPKETAGYAAPVQVEVPTSPKIEISSPVMGQPMQLRQITQVAIDSTEEPVWIPDEDTKYCMLCGIYFTVIIRRHHCRNCGKILCGKCSDRRRKLVHTKKEVRVCKICDAFLAQDETRPKLTSSSQSSFQVEKPVPNVVLLDHTQAVSAEMTENPLLVPTKGISLEKPQNYTLNKPKLIGQENNTAYYQHYFANKEHVNYIGISPEVGPVIISIDAPEMAHTRASLKELDAPLRVLVRTKNTDIWLFIPWNWKSLKKSVKEALEAEDSDIAAKLAGIKLMKVTDPRLPKELVAMEQKLVPVAFKIGVLYCKEGQSTEAECFQNTESSPEFQEFLEFLGEKITLSGWTGYKGGLDVKLNSTGTHSIFTSHTGLSVMFHVSTLLPYSPADEQQIERKRHLGNDVIIVVFKDSDTDGPFKPESVKSEFNHIFVIVTVDKTRSVDGKTFYRLAVGAKDGGKVESPPLPSPAVIEKNAISHDWFIAKLINCERSTLAGPAFYHKIAKAREQLMQLVVNEFKS